MQSNQLITVALLCPFCLPNCLLHVVFSPFFPSAVLEPAALIVCQRALPQPSCIQVLKRKQSLLGRCSQQGGRNFNHRALLPFPLLLFWHSNNDPTGFSVWLSSLRKGGGQNKDEASAPTSVKRKYIFNSSKSTALMVDLICGSYLLADRCFNKHEQHLCFCLNVRRRSHAVRLWWRWRWQAANPIVAETNRILHRQPEKQAEFVVGN